ncbi:hypothetical protein COCNU_06G006670 [Cocos nucifera]|uniref:Uncharacterized protein n=1 Tax=Cocos nucifera TaxID=13894 RepID=A0A8K0N2E6_COCNU|nr:hypothetical protein COCNU_06G006670 [Cocos nucifera]
MDRYRSRKRIQMFQDVKTAHSKESPIILTTCDKALSKTILRLRPILKNPTIPNQSDLVSSVNQSDTLSS